jgi:hypothetical protein
MSEGELGPIASSLAELRSQEEEKLQDMLGKLDAVEKYVAEFISKM